MLSTAASDAAMLGATLSAVMLEHWRGIRDLASLLPIRTPWNLHGNWMGMESEGLWNPISAGTPSRAWAATPLASNGSRRQVRFTYRYRFYVLHTGM